MAHLGLNTIIAKKQWHDILWGQGLILVQDHVVSQ